MADGSPDRCGCSVVDLGHSAGGGVDGDNDQAISQGLKATKSHSPAACSGLDLDGSPICIVSVDALGAGGGERQSARRRAAAAYSQMQLIKYPSGVKFRPDDLSSRRRVTANS